MTVKPSLSDPFFFLLNIFVFQFYVKSVSPVSDRDLLKLVLGTCIDITMRPIKEIAPGKAGSRTQGDRVMPLFLCLSPQLDPTSLCVDFRFQLILLSSAAPRLLVLRVRNPDKRAGPFLGGHLWPSVWHCWITGLSQADLWVLGWVAWSSRLASMSRPVVRKEVGQQAGGTFTWVT